MNKRILSIVLTLIMLVGLVPAAAFHASAAGMSTSESAITVLKQLEGYSKTCSNNKGLATSTDLTATYYTGYGTVCNKPADNVYGHANHVTSEKEADKALREELKDLDKAVNSFASRNGLSLSQSKHDALVLFSFQNGTAWTTGTGDFQNAVKSGIRGSDFLNAICNWSRSDNNNRRKIEANMYLNGTYSTYVPTNYIKVTYQPNGGQINNQPVDVNLERYYDTASGAKTDIIPTKAGQTFMGWYLDGKQITSLSSYKKDITLTANWQIGTDPLDKENTVNDKALSVHYEVTASDRVHLYNWTAGEPDKKTKEVKWSFKGTEDTKTSDRWDVKGKLTIDYEFIDAKNVRWGHVASAEKLYQNGEKVTKNPQIPTGKSNSWIRLGSVNFSSGSSGSFTSYDMDVTVTVTNAYVRVRAEDSIYSKELRQAKLGDQLRIVNTSSNDGFLWGQIADADNDGVCEGWVALMYTNFEEVRGQSGNTQSSTSHKVVATALVNVNGYVNVRSGAGTNNKIVGALPDKSRVDIYEITYVNGIQWGRYSGGWFCLAYAYVEGIDVDDYANTSGVLAYAFNGKILDASEIYTQAGGTTVVDQDQMIKDKKLKKEDKIKDGDTVVVSNLTNISGVTWGKISIGWVEVTNADYSAANVKLNVAKYYTVVDGVTVRTEPKTSASRVNNLVKGVEFNVNDHEQSGYQIIVVGDTIWGYADKVGESDKTYSGWVNLASKYVARGDAPASGTNKNDTPTGEMATIVGADNVNVRIHHDIYAKKLGTIPRGTTVAVLGLEDGWYKLDYDVDNNSETDSWVSAKYVEVTKASAGSNGGGSGSNGGSANVETGMGIVANTYGGVNVRSGAGTGYAQVGKLLPGTQVEILEVTTRGASKWGRVKEGWICMDYVTMINNYEILAGLVGGNGTGNNSGSGNGTVTGSEVAIYTGTAKQDLTIYKTTSTDSDHVREISAGSPITLHEIITVKIETVVSSSDDSEGSSTVTKEEKRYWARVNDGYIERPAENLNLDALDEAIYTVTESDTLNVRNSYGTDGTAIIHKLKKGDRVVVTELQIVNGNVWGKVEADAVYDVTKDEEGNESVDSWNGEGWISLAYCTKGSVSVNTGNQNNNNQNNNQNQNQDPNSNLGQGSSTGGFVTNSSGYRYTGKVINTDSLNVRATASQTASKTTSLSRGASLVIYETTISENMAWGRCDAGWVYLYYVDLTPAVSGVVDARVVYNDNTIIYSDVNGSETVGTYARMSVIDIYEIVGKMARTEQGWVSTDNLL